MVVLVSGGAGFIGTNLVRRLIKKGAQVHILQKSSSDLWRLREIKNNLIFHHEDLGNKKALLSLLQKICPEIIYHLAAYGNYPTQEDEKKMVVTNILGTFNLLLASKDIPYQCFVNTGSSSEYGFKSRPMREDNVCQPISFYGASKLAGTALCQVFAKNYQKPIVTFRPFSVYGPYEKKSRFIPTLILALIKGKEIKLTPGIARHDFVYVKDLIDAYLKVPTRINRVSGKIFNLGSGQEYTNDEVVEVLFEVTGKKVLVEKEALTPRKWDNPHWRADISQAKKLLHWQPQFSFKKGLFQTFQWFLKNRSLYEK